MRGNGVIGEKGNREPLCFLSYPFLLFAFYPCEPFIFGGRGRDRTADAGLFRAAYRFAEVV